MSSSIDNEEKEDQKERKLIEDIIQSEDRVKGLISFRVVKNWLRLTGG